LVGNQAAGLTITAGVNDSVQFAVDGTSATVTLAAGTYATAAALASEIQSKVNGATALSSAGIKVSISESGDVFTVASQSYGLTSNVSVTSSAGADNLFGATPVITSGVNATGTLEGASMTGSGQTLTATNGLGVKVLGGSTGARGTVTYSQGIAYQMDQLIGQYLGSKGLISNRTDGINASIKSLNDREEEFARRLTGIETRYRAQFTALDSLIASMNTTSTFLTQQLTNLNKSSN
jgi:flagellar hook-associated protein 2